jgi:hypothetical protein
LFNIPYWFGDTRFLPGTDQDGMELSHGANYLCLSEATVPRITVTVAMVVL